MKLLERAGESGTNSAVGQWNGGHKMEVVLWVVQGSLALVFLAVGLAKVGQCRERLVARMPGLGDLPHSTVRTIGALEILGATGLVLPVITGILPWLTPLAAAGLVLLMIGAAFFNLRHRKYSGIIAN
jgi:uncharacterized membrane protein YphA (DoxX/SURF4 family)